MNFSKKISAAVLCGLILSGTASVHANDLTAGLTAELFKMMDEPIVIDEPVEIVKETMSPKLYKAKQFKRLGIVYYGDYKYTWYSERVLPGRGLNIPGRHVDNNGYVCDTNNYICGASQMHPKGTVLDSPFGKKIKIYDWCDIKSIDVYTSW